MQNGKFQLRPWEETRVSPGEYIYSLNSLKRFVEIVDISQLHTLEDIAAVTSLVGHDLTVITKAKGREAEERTAYFEARADDPFGGTQTVYTFRTLLHNRELGGNGEGRLCHAFKIYRYRLPELPARRDADCAAVG